jgi:hypothetical protein
VPTKPFEQSLLPDVPDVFIAKLTLPSGEVRDEAFICADRWSFWNRTSSPGDAKAKIEIRHERTAANAMSTRQQRRPTEFLGTNLKKEKWGFLFNLPLSNAFEAAVPTKPEGQAAAG